MLKVVLKMYTNLIIVRSQLTNMVVYDIETFNTDRAVPYDNCIYGLSIFSGKYNRDISEKEYKKGLNGCIVFKGLDNINQMLDYVLQFKGEPKRIIMKIVILIYAYLLIKEVVSIHLLFQIIYFNGEQLVCLKIYQVLFL